MSPNNFINKIRYWDNMTAKWIIRHFYTVFFQIILVIIFVFWFINLFSVIDTTLQVDNTNLMERFLATQSTNSTIIVFLLILNSFWMLFMFNSLLRLRTLLKDINYNIIRRKTQRNYQRHKPRKPPKPDRA